MTSFAKTITLRPHAKSPDRAIEIDGKPFPFHVSSEVPVRVEAINALVSVVYLPVLVETVQILAGVDEQ